MLSLGRRSGCPSPFQGVCSRTFRSGVDLHRQLDGAFGGQGSFTEELLASLLLRSAPPLPDGAGDIDDDGQAAFVAASAAGDISWANLKVRDCSSHVGHLHVIQYGVSGSSARQLLCKITDMSHSSVQPLPSGHRVSISVLHGGSHAYRGLTRPFSIALSHALQLQAELLDIVTRHINVDGSFQQAMLIKGEVERLAETLGVTAGIEELRAELLSVSKPYSSLVNLGIQRRRVHSLQRAASVEANERALKAVGEPGSETRIAQALAILESNRAAINSSHIGGIVPCSAAVLSGPASVSALLHFIFEVERATSSCG